MVEMNPRMRNIIHKFLDIQNGANGVGNPKNNSSIILHILN